MLFSEEHSQHLKKWIVERLENTSDADPDVLADYVLALLRHDGNVDDVRKLCEEEMPDFLKEDSPVFVSDLFQALTYQSYLPGARPPPQKYAALPTPGDAGQPPPSLYYDDSPVGAAPTYPPPFRNGSRKRPYTDWDDPNAQQNGRDAGIGARAFKQPRRGGRASRPDDFRGVAAGIPPYHPPGQLSPQGPPGPSLVGYFHPKGAMDAAAMFGMSLAAGHPMPELLSQERPRRRKKCRDWEKKGYCQRGSNCKFAHSDDPVYPPPPGPPFGAMQPVPQPPAVEEYDPANALIPDLFNGRGPISGQTAVPDIGRPLRLRGGKHQNRQSRGEKAPFSADGPVFDRAKSTIVVENIPEENFSEDQVKGFFSQFGYILDISMQPYKRLAIVKFDSWNAANAAYQSPKVIFDNRFVKVFWYKDDESALPASAPMVGGAPGAKRAQATSGSSLADGSHAGPHPEIDLEEFAKQQEEKQRAYEEKLKKREELERQREELERRQKELLAKQLEEKARLEAKLAGRNGSKSDENGDSPKKPMSQTEALRAQLAALEAEARQMGLDPDALDTPTPWPSRGGYGRGRGAWRGASPYTPRGSFRGGFRGRGNAGNVHAAYAAYSLDNRPKKVIVTGADFTVPERDETLRQYLFGIGEFTDVQTNSTFAEITFKDRKTAEKFLNSVLLNNKEIPGLDASSPLELAWGGPNGSAGSAPTTPGATTTTTTTTTTTITPSNAKMHQIGTGPAGIGSVDPATKTPPTGTRKGHGGGDGDDDGPAAGAGSSSDKDVHILLERPPGHGHGQGRDLNEMDYEVADEEQWGYQ
ncbi:hypothetical protein N657DRAFT_614503 [Parathielavia appendiculata]|uniref:Uncharacterized protein n=1 Tax=Parathielavia appendiculata TaxID=2587402 RepID=A0AAN6U440_9PEZI|nr:hypothetical protein N657DRAFT_614503 [Parathielavia appendiculata]